MKTRLERGLMRATLGLFMFMMVAVMMMLATSFTCGCIAGNRTNPASANDDSVRTSEVKQEAGRDATSETDQSETSGQKTDIGTAGPVEITNTKDGVQGWFVGAGVFLIIIAYPVERFIRLKYFGNGKAK